MKTEFQAKFLQSLLKKRESEGFTLIELLVVIIIIGILSAIALPSFLNQANKAKQSEAKTYVGSMNRAQQAYYLENDTFAANGVTAGATVTSITQAITALGLGIKQNTQYYNYSIVTAALIDRPSGTVTLKASSLVTNQARPATASASSLKAYVGGVTIGTQAGTGEATTLGVLCEAKKAPIETGGDLGAQEIVYADIVSNPPACTGEYKQLK
jgi:type IV pilus assembly protein PilA